MPKKNKSFSPYFTEADADKVRAAVQEAGHLEGYASISDLIEAATLREVKRPQRKYNGGKKWPGYLRASSARAAAPAKKSDTGMRTSRHAERE